MASVLLGFLVDFTMVKRLNGYGLKAPGYLGAVISV